MFAGKECRDVANAINQVSFIIECFIGNLFQSGCQYDDNINFFIALILSNLSVESSDND